MSAGKNCRNAYNLSIPDSFTTHHLLHIPQDWERADSYSSAIINKVISVNLFPLHAILVPSLRLWCDGFLSLPLEAGLHFILSQAAFSTDTRKMNYEVPTHSLPHNLIPKTLFFHQKSNATFSL